MELLQVAHRGDVILVVDALVERALWHSEQTLDGLVTDEGQQQRERRAVRLGEDQVRVRGVVERLAMLAADLFEELRDNLGVTRSERDLLVPAVVGGLARGEDAQRGLLEHHLLGDLARRLDKRRGPLEREQVHHGLGLFSRHRDALSVADRR